MKQILQNLKTGDTEVVDVPCPACPPGHLRVVQPALGQVGGVRLGRNSVAFRVTGAGAWCSGGAATEAS